MIKMLNKFVSFIAIGIIGYLTYSSISEPASSKAESGKKLPVITKKMIMPEFIEPQAYASPANRDPFTASWDKFIAAAATNKSKGVAFSGTANFPQKLMGVLSDANGRSIAMIGSEVYGVGSSVTLADANEVWQVDSITNESAVLTHDGQRAVLVIAENYNDSNDSNNIQIDSTEIAGQKEPVK
jgi:hypothetical protein